MRKWLFCLLVSLLSACASVAPSVAPDAPVPGGSASSDRPPETVRQRALSQEVVMYALTLIDTGYRFGGKNPEAGLDCSGMVSYVFDNAIGVKLRGSAADIARRGREVPLSELRPGDLVFFNTLNRPYSHVGIYIGNNRFAHAPNTGSKVRLDSIKNRWWAARVEEARTYLE